MPEREQHGSPVQAHASEASEDGPIRVGSGAFERALVETVRTPLLVLDPTFRVVSANPAFLSVYRFAADEVVGMRVFDLGSGQWDVAALRFPLERVLPDEEEIRDLEIEVDLGDLGQRFLRINARQVRLDGQAEPLILLAVEDETDRSLYEEKIEAYAHELERSNQDLESFAHAASHDLQEPLRKISIYVEHLTGVLEPESLDDRTRTYLERMPEAVERMQVRINDLLQLARIGRAEVERRPTDLNDVVRSVLSDLETSLAETGGTVDVGELPVVLADPTQMRILFQNLVSNGLKFHKKDGAPSVRIHAFPVNGSQRPGWWTVVVEDEGIGFEETYAERVFLPFHRLHGREAYEGSGVGLAICQRVVEAHGGSMRAEGRPTDGARFFFTLPGLESGETST